MDGSGLEEKSSIKDDGVDSLFEIGLGFLHYPYC